MPTADHGFAGLDDTRLLVSRIQAGDTDAYHQLYQRTFPTLLRFAYHIIGSREAAEDAVQSVFFNIWVNHQQWHPVGPLGAYLYRAVRNAVLDTIRHAQLVGRAEAASNPDAPYGMGTPSRRADTVVEADDEVHSLAKAIRTLSERQRTAILLRWYDEMPIADVAHVMNISRQGVEKLLRAAETKLRAILRER